MRRTLGVLGLTAVLSCPFGLVARAQSPITGITTKMSGVAGELAKKETGEPVQTRQKAVVNDLDELIAALERQCQACKNGIKRNNPSRGLPDSVIRSGTGGIGTLGAPADTQKEWSKLSERERDRILQSMSEGFPPEYRTVLERYYRRLAEEKTAPSSSDRALPKAAESKPGNP
jgi:hypothetical protein